MKIINVIPNDDDDDGGDKNNDNDNNNEYANTRIAMTANLNKYRNASVLLCRIGSNFVINESLVIESMVNKVLYSREQYQRYVRIK